MDADKIKKKPAPDPFPPEQEEETSEPAAEGATATADPVVEEQPEETTTEDATTEAPRAKISDFKITTPDGESVTLGDIGEQAKDIGGQLKEALKQPGKKAIGDVEQTGIGVVGEYAGMAIDGLKSFAAGWFGKRGPERNEEKDNPS